jgi:hypothetical protein
MFRSGKGRLSTVSPPKLNICETLFRSALGSFIQGLFGEIESDHLSGGRDAFGLASVCQLQTLGLAASGVSPCCRRRLV